MKNQRGFTLVEVLVVIGIMAVILGIAAGPFVDMYRRGKIEDRASTLHETFKWAQSQAMKGGESAMSSTGVLTKHMIYLAVNQDESSYKVVRWIDANADNVKDASEITEMQKGVLQDAKFGMMASVNKTACGNSGAPTSTNPVVNFSLCPTVASSTVFTNHVCTRFDGKGFLSDALKNEALYITNDRDNYAVSLNPAGVMTLCKWTGTAWLFIR